MPDLEIENRYKDNIIAGVDEAGRGPLAGPVVAAAVIVDQKNIIDGINDSKKLSKKRREYLYDQITSGYLWSVGIIEVDEIDRINILEATKKACVLAVKSLDISPSIVLIDGNMCFADKRFCSIIKGDDKSISIAAASIIAKVTRDRIMQELSKECPDYKWDRNSGYGTKEHINAILQNGYTSYHRKTFKVKKLITRK